MAEGGGLLNREAPSPQVTICTVEARFIGFFTPLSAALIPASSGLFRLVRWQSRWQKPRRRFAIKAFAFGFVMIYFL